jgi:GT2 family glycosyltransferase
MVHAVDTAMKSVSVMIATRDRLADLTDTVKRLECCRSVISELIIVDDGSAIPVPAYVASGWNDARVIRHDHSVGQCQRRSEGFREAAAPYILQLDDDSCPTDESVLGKAIEYMETFPHLGAVVFHIHNGPIAPRTPGARRSARYVASFVGCGVLLRTAAVRQVGGYLSFFGNEWEEEELSIRLNKAGWGLYYDPFLTVHHRVSRQNRRSERTWMRGFRNKLWSLVMHLPGDRVLVEGVWVLTVAFWDACRMLRFGWFLTGLWQFVIGLPRAIRLRDPMSGMALARYDALRFGPVLTQAEFNSPGTVSISDMWRWFATIWWNRARQRSFWDRRSGDIGGSPTVDFTHEGNN